MAYIRDGFKTLLLWFRADNQTWHYDTDDTDGLFACIREMEFTPPTIEGGGPNDTSTMRNVAWRTRQPKSLKTLGQMTIVCSMDPAVYQVFVNIVNKNRPYGIRFPDGAAVVLWAWMDNVAPQSAKEGEMPRIEIVLIPSNQDNALQEAAPEYIAPGDPLPSFQAPALGPLSTYDGIFANKF